MNLSTHKSKQRSGEKKLRRKCSVKGCKAPAVTFTALKGWCSPEHGALVAEQLLARKKTAAAKAERQADKVKRESMLTIPQLKAMAQKAFNAFRREWCRVNGFVSCPCCDLPLDWNSNEVDCGHYRSTGSADHMRFVEDNAWAQRKQCNRYGAGRAVDYRMGLVKRIGIERVEALEANNTVIKWTREMLIEIRKIYQAKLNALAKAEA